MKKILESCFLALGNALPRLSLFDKLRYRVYRLAGMAIGERTVIWGPLVVRPVGGAGNITIGAGCFLNTETRFGAPDRIILGDHVQIGPRVSFETAGHGLVYLPGKGRGTVTRPVQVEDEVWIGAGAIILPGVRIGRGAVVMAGAVVAKDVAPRTLVGGVPARWVKDIEPSKEETPQALPAGEAERKRNFQ